MALLITSSCKTVPTKPTVEACVLNYPSSEFDCGLTRGKFIATTTDLYYPKFVNLIYNAEFGTYKKPIEYMDRGICFTPPWWSMLVDYMHDLEVACKR